MEILKGKSGVIRYKEKVYLPDGTSRTKTFLRKTDATKWKQDIESQKRRDPSVLLKPQETFTFSEVYESWMNAKIYSKRSARTVYSYQRYYKAHLEVRFGLKKIDILSGADFDILSKSLLDKGMKEKSVNNVMTYVKQILKYAQEEGFLTENPMRRFKKIPESQRDIQYLSKEEVFVLLRSNRFEPIYPILVMAVNTGMRIGEIFGLCWDCVNFETNRLVIKRSLSRKALNERTKTKLIRFIPMNNTVKQLLSEMMKSQKSTQFVFTDEIGKPLRPDHYSSREFKKALEVAKLKRIRFHDLRHTYASNYMMNGGNLYDLQKILGHTKSEMTNIYAHLSPEHLQGAINVVNFAIQDEKDSIVKSNSPYLALVD